MHKWKVSKFATLRVSSGRRWIKWVVVVAKDAKDAQVAQVAKEMRSHSRRHRKGSPELDAVAKDPILKNS